MREDVSGQEILLVYDKQCPACDKYCQRIDIHQLAGPLRRVDARHPSDVLAEVTAQGLDIDQGMVVKMGGELYYGADAIHALALISSRSGIFNRLNYWVFRSARVSRLFYPGLKFCRNLLLKILGVTKINNLGVSGKGKF